MNSRTKAIAVIGANYGDEGKGVTTHSLARRHNSSCVVRFNGGPQAGHTVHLSTPSIKHVFSSYASGTFAGAKTYVSRCSLFNPRAANEERLELLALANSALPSFTLPELQVDPGTHVITPWDVVLNQLLERGRGPNAHGSCGMGIGETELRKTTPGAPVLLAGQLQKPLEVFQFLADIRQWFKKRTKEEAEAGSFTYLNEAQQAFLKDCILSPSHLINEMYAYAAYMNHFKVGQFIDPVIDLTTDHAEGPKDKFIFEGAQGLLLSDDPANPKYTTWSKTGLDNVIQECIRQKINLTEVHYVTRPYLTRHGAGPIPIEVGIEILPAEGEKLWGRDYTNRTNEFQGSLRYAHLNWVSLKSRIQVEHAKLKDTPFKDAKAVLTVTCVDQTEMSETCDMYDHDSDPSNAFKINSEDFTKYVSLMFANVATVEILDGRKG